MVYPTVELTFSNRRRFSDEVLVLCKELDGKEIFRRQSAADGARVSRQPRPDWQAIGRGLSGEETVHVPEGVKSDQRTIRKARAELESRGQPAGESEIAAYLGWKTKRVHRALEAQRQKAGQRSLNDSFGPEGEEELGAFIPANETDDNDREELKNLIEPALTAAGLSERSKKVIKMHFGIGCEPLTHAEIGKILNLTHARVHQIETEAPALLQANGNKKELRSLAAFLS